MGKCLHANILEPELHLWRLRFWDIPLGRLLKNSGLPLFWMLDTDAPGRHSKPQKISVVSSCSDEDECRFGFEHAMSNALERPDATWVR
jgi:hypothetical protein